MSDVVYLRLGTADHISLPAFIDSLKNFMQVLKDLDATIAKDSLGNVKWEVVSLQKNSPAVVGVAPIAKRGRIDTSSIVESQLFENARLLSTKSERTEFFSDAALMSFQRIAQKAPKLGTFSLYLNGNGPIREQVDISEITLQNVRGLTSAKYSAFASVYGSLDTISVHSGNEFRVWDERSNKPIRCKFKEMELDQVITYLGKRVMVAGTILSNAAGNPISVEVEAVQLADRPQIPTIEEMSGLVPDFTGGVPLKEYMEFISDE
jgi:hypothetical protein